MVNWQSHPSFEREFKKLSKRYIALDFDFAFAKRLLEQYFFHDFKIPPIAPGKLHLITKDNLRPRDYWKLELSVQHLRPNLCPRVWFVRDNNSIIFLAIASHTDNYDDNNITNLALTRYNEIEN
jgi:hypothetical protein